MSISYDPMTGEPIETADETVTTDNTQITGYDPMTGEPIYGGAGQQTGFDPMTGEPVYGYTGDGMSPVETPKKKFPVWILIVAAIVVLVVVLGVVVVKAFGGGTNVKIAKAVANTCQTSPLLKELQCEDLVKDGEYTMGIGVNVETIDDYYYSEMEGMSVDMQLASDMNKGKYAINGTVKWDEYDLDLGFESYLDKKEIAAAVPAVAEYTFVYDFTEEKDGYLVDVLGDDAVEQVDALLQWMTTQDNSKQNEKLASDLSKALAGQFKTWEFESDKSREYEVNGKKHSCKAYTITVTDDMLIDMLESIEDIYDEYYEAQQKEIEDLLEVMGDDFDIDIDDMDMGDAFKEIKSALKDMPEMDVTLYLYKDQLAAVVVDDSEDDITVELQIKGGDYPMQNWELIAEVDGDEAAIVKTGKVKGSVEQNEIEIDGVDVTIEWSYDSKSGDLTAEIGYDDVTFTAEGNIKKSSDELLITVENFTYEDSYWEETMEFSGYLSINGKASVSKPSYKEFDLGNASEDDFMDIYEEAEENLYDLFY